MFSPFFNTRGPNYYTRPPHSSQRHRPLNINVTSNNFLEEQNRQSPIAFHIIERLIQDQILPEQVLNLQMTDSKIEKFRHLEKMSFKIEKMLQTEEIMSFFARLTLPVPRDLSELLKLVEPSKHCIQFARENNYLLLTDLSVRLDKNLDSSLLRRVVLQGHSTLVEMLFLTDAERSDFKNWAKPIEKLIRNQILPESFYSKICSDAMNKDSYEHFNKMKDNIEVMFTNEDIQSFFATLKLQVPRDLSELLLLVDIPQCLDSDFQENNYLFLTDLSVRLDKNLGSKSLRETVLRGEYTLGEMLFVTDDKRAQVRAWAKQHAQHFYATRESAYRASVFQDQRGSNAFYRS